MAGFYADAGAHTTIFNGKTSVTTAGTRVQLLTTSTGIHTVVVRANSANTGTIYVGNATVASTNGMQLAAGDALTLTINDLSKVYLDCSVNGEGVTYIAT